MQFLYNIGIRLLGLSIRFIALFDSKAKEWVNGRKSLFDQYPATKGKRVVWFHCASLGEFDQGLPLMNLIKEQHADIYLLVTFFSPSGMKHCDKRNHKSDRVTYLPLDTRKNARKFIKYYRPEVVFFVKYEYWSNHIFEAKRNGAKIYNVSGLFRPNHRFFKWYGSYFRKTLRAFDHFFLQNNDSIELLKGIGINNASVTGDTRYDKVIDNKNHLEVNPILQHFCKNSTAIIVGSSWPEDEKVVVPYINQTQNVVIIAPHEISEIHIKSIEKQITRPTVRYTHLSENESTNAKVLILDTIGHLATAYSYGHIAYVGGGFSGSLHNILEPAVFGLPVIFGPKYDRFPEAHEFINGSFGFSIDKSDEFIDTITKIEQSYSSISENEIAYVQSHSGGASKIMDFLTSNSIL